MSSESPLTRLLEEAFPPDWDATGSAPSERLGASLRHRDASERRRIVGEVEALLQRGLCEMQLSDVIAYELGAHLSPQDMGLTPSAWLMWVLQNTRI